MKKISTSTYLNKIYKNPRDRVEIFLEIPITQRANVFLSLRKHLQYVIVKALNEKQLISLLETLDPDDATDVLQFLGDTYQQKILTHLKDEIKDELSMLLKFDERTAGGLMGLNYIQVESDQTIASISKKFRDHEKRTGKPPEIIVLDQGKVIGYVPGYQLGFSKPGERVRKYLKKIHKIKHTATYEEVIERFRSHPHNKVVVLGEHHNVVGVIYSDDVLKVLKEQEGSTLYDFAGVHDEEEITDSAKIKIRFRHRWLILNLATAFLASFVVSIFDSTINKNVLLAVYMPIVAGMGGNAGTQTLAIMVRGITLNQIDITNFWKPLGQEVLAAFVNGSLNGLLVFLIVMILNNSPLVAFILAISMVINLMVAATFGTIVPVVMKSLGKDPASSATIFITTATDVLGFLAFLGLATLLL